MKLKHLQRVWLTRIKKFLNRNFNPYYRDIRYLANVNDIVKELHIFENRLIKDHNVCLERNEKLRIEREELETYITEHLKSCDVYKDKDFGKITVFTESRVKTSEDIYNNCMLAYNYQGSKKILSKSDNVEFNLRYMLYSLCLVNCQLVKTNVFYKLNDKTLPLSDFFQTLLLDLVKEFGNKSILVDPHRFFGIYAKLYPDYVFKHILNISNFERL